MTYEKTAGQHAFRASDVGLLASSCDVKDASSSVACASGFIYVSKLWVPQTITVTNLLLKVQAIGNTLTAGDNLAGIYDSNGNLVAATADQSAAWHASTGLKTMALTAQGAFSLTLAGGPSVFYWAAMLNVGTTPTQPAATPGSNVIAHPGLGAPYVASVPGAKHRTGFESVGGRTALLSLNTLSLSDSGFTNVIWFALS